MAESKPQKAWQQYIDNAGKDINVELENENDFNEKKKAEITALFLEAQTFEDVFSAVKIIGEIEDSPRTYEPTDLEGILKDVKDKKAGLNQVPEAFGLREAASRSLEAINHQEYQRNLKNLFGEFKRLFEAKDFNEVFISMKDSSKDDAETKKGKLKKEYNSLRLLCSPDNKTDLNGQTPPEILEIAKQASAMLEAYKAKADNFIEGKLSAEMQAKNEKEFTLDFINDRLKKGETIKVKIERGGTIEDGWRIENVNGSDVVVKKKGTAGTTNVKLDDLKKWNAYAYIKKNVTDPKDNDTEKKKIEDNLPVAEELGKNIVSKETEEAKQAFEKRKGFNAKKAELEKSKKKEPVTPELIARHKEIADKIKELEEDRKKYLETDYDKTAKLQRLKKFFSNNFGGEKVDAAKDYRTSKDISKNDPEIGDLREKYEKKLQELQTLILDDARERGLSNEELVNLYASFRIEQKITLADEHDKVKAANIPLMGEKIVGMVAWYQKLHWTKKIAIAGGFMVAGAGVAGFTLAGVTFAGAGASTAGIFASVVTARRIFGGLVAGVGAKQGLEVRGQKKDQKEIESEQQKILKELEKIKEQDKKYQKLATKFDEIVTKDGQDALEKIKNQDFRQNLTAGLAGTFLASGLAGELIKMGYHGALEHFGPKGNWNPFAHHEIPKAHLDLKNTANGPENSGIGKQDVNAGGKVPVAPATEGITIEKGDSIEGAIRDHIRENHADLKIKNLGKLNHNLWLNYMSENKDAIIAESGEKEYAKMLKDGMVNVKIGSKIFLDSHDADPTKWKLVSLTNADGKTVAHLSHLNVHHHAPHVEHQHVAPAQHIETSGVEPKASSPVSEDSSPRFEKSGKQIYLEYSTDQQTAPEPFKTSGPEIYLDKPSAGLSREALNNLVAGDRRVTNPNLLRDLFSSGASKEKILKTCLAEFTKGEGVNWSEVKDVKIADLIQNRPGVRAGMRTLATNFRPLVGERLAGDRSFAFSDKVLNQTPKQWLAGVVSAASKNRVV